MAEYSKEEIKRIEDKWRDKWDKDQVYKTWEDPAKPKYYVLDMFPYPSGAGLHVGHPLGYIASDIVARYKRIKGFNVLHPMGFDAFGLPAEQYAIQTGQHPAITTARNIETYKRQLRQIGFSFDWSREVQTCDPGYYKWTQWIFMQLFNSFYNKKRDKTEPIANLIAELEKNGNKNILAVSDDETPQISAEGWKSFDERGRENFLQKYRIAYLSETMVNWCPALGTVLSNDEVKDGVSERGGYPVERKKMWQWSMRISAYAERLLAGLNTIDWPEPLKEMQRNWIGKSVGCELEFHLTPALSRGEGGETPLKASVKGLSFISAKASVGKPTLFGVEGEGRAPSIRVFTTRIDTIYGVTFMVLAPEHELVEKITTDVQRAEVTKYVEVAKNRSERERLSEVKRITGVFTGAYVINPFNQQKVPVWIAEYVLAGYGTGAVMAVPSSDTRDYAFAKHFNLPIIDILAGPHSDITKDTFDPKSGKMINSDFLNGLPWDEAIEKALQKVEELGIGERKVNYRMRDAIFGRQRYWGEPFPVYFKDGIPKLVREEDLPITLPEVDAYKPTESGEPPLGRAKEWRYYLTPTLSKGEGDGPFPEESGRKSPVIATGGGVAQDHIFTTDEKTWKVLKENARENRRNATPAEDKLWQAVRGSKLGHRFRRQHAIGRFIADLVCIEKKLVVEIDGPIHERQEASDIERTNIINQEGFRVIRFTNDHVINHLGDVLTKIRAAITPPSPLERESEGEVAYPFELTTMPGWASSSWYWYRYMDPQNDDEFCSREKESYWKDVDLYIGGSEHATGHLLYSRFWNKALKDLGFVEAEEPFKKLINQGHIQGVSKFVFRLNYVVSMQQNEKPIFLSKEIKTRLDDEKWLAENKDWNNKFRDAFHSLLNLDSYAVTVTRIAGDSKTSAINADISLVDGDKLNIEAFKKWRPEYQNAEFILEDELGNPLPYGNNSGGVYICTSVVEKMSKSKYNVVNPDDIIEKYGADTLRMYEMFLGPLEQSKPWNTNGIDGVYKFLRRFWNLSHDSAGNFNVSDAEPARDELKVLHKTLRKIEQDIDHFSFNTSVSELMICANELSSLQCNKRAVIEPLVIALSPFAPHISEELWEKLGYPETILKAKFPRYDEQYLKENSFEYPISINGKVRAMMNFALDMPKEDIEKQVLASEAVTKWTEGKTPKKVIIVQGKIVNVVL